MLKSRCGELGASLIDCSEGERACVCERETEREERERGGGNVFKCFHFETKLYYIQGFQPGAYSL